ncbi:uncharacterized protein LOC117298952 [Asterias rubens]|uniref:uncharacterized protein LOC117298952 n=1 Tax=Asterias rubens TaxID=7604 RepID=UPI001455A9FC|nr:uncharacterized protein LOC117298952 [Asterias rubens]
MKSTSQRVCMMHMLHSVKVKDVFPINSKGCHLHRDLLINQVDVMRPAVDELPNNVQRVREMNCSLLDKSYRQMPLSDEVYLFNSRCVIHMLPSVKVQQGLPHQQMVSTCHTEDFGDLHRV